MKNVFCVFICVLLSLALLLCGCTQKIITTHGFEYYKANGYNYTLQDGKAVLIEKTDNKYDDIVVLPNTIDGYPVVGIGRYEFNSIYGVNSLGMFEKDKNVKEVILPSGLETIEYMAFAYSSVESIEFPGTISNMGDCVMEDCNSLTDVKIGYGITEITEGMFSCCRSLKEIVLPKSIKTIDTGAFAFCESLEKIVIYDGVDSIENDAFINCDNLTIYGIKGSNIEEYAKEHEIPFVELN